MRGLWTFARAKPLQCGALSPLFSRVPGLPPERAPRSGMRKLKVMPRREGSLGLPSPLQFA
jgi:hypothetical protein